MIIPQKLTTWKRWRQWRRLMKLHPWPNVWNTFDGRPDLGRVLIIIDENKKERKKVQQRLFRPSRIPVFTVSFTVKVHYFQIHTTHKSHASKNWILTSIVSFLCIADAGTFVDISMELPIQHSGSEFTSSADLSPPLPISVFQTLINIRQVPYRDVTHATHPQPALHAAMTFQLHIWYFN